MPSASGTFGKKHFTFNKLQKTVNCQPLIFYCRLWRHPRRGYTLIEFVVVLGLLVLAIGSTLAFLTNSLRSSNQANVTSEVKQNGQIVLDSLERQIRNANSASQISLLPSGASSGVNLSITGGKAIYIACFTTTGTTNGWIGIASVSSGTDTSILGNYRAVTNTDTISGVDVSDTVSPPGCNLSVTSATPGTANPDVVLISFTLNQGISAPSRQDFKANARFQTTISLRKY